MSQKKKGWKAIRAYKGPSARVGTSVYGDWEEGKMGHGRKARRKIWTLNSREKNNLRTSKREKTDGL